MRQHKNNWPEIAAGTLSLNDAIRRVTEKTANQFQQDVAALGCLAPDHQPRATEHIDGMIAMAQSLIDKGHAYVATGKEGREVLFDVSSMPDYGKLSNRKIEDQQAGARVAVEAHKKNPGDFVLWKESTGDLPGWPAHFHQGSDHIDIFGRPGWHIECSVMSEHHLGQTFDIHGGGLDLIFPHHENEIAQSCCAHGTKAMANYWMHNEFLRLEDAKMSKSLGNFITIDELLSTDEFGGRKWTGEVLRLAMLMTHYREPINFTVRRLEEAEGMLDKWRKTIAESHLTTASKSGRPSPSVVEALLDDLNSPAAIMQLQKTHTFANRFRGNSEKDDIARFAATIDFLGFDHSKWISVANVALPSDVTTIAETGIEQRLTALTAKNFAEADRIRDKLSAYGIQLMDYKDAETGERKTKWEVKR